MTPAASPAASRPTAPTNLRTAVAPTRGVGSHQVRLSWQAPRSNGGASIADYVIQRSSNGGGSWRTVADGASTSRNVTIGGLTNGTRYRFRVAAKNRVGVGAWSGTASATPATRPGVPRSLTAESANHAVRLSWQAPRSNGGASIADYVIQRSSNGGGSWRTVADGASTSRNVTIGGLTNGTRYRFRVAAKNRVGVGAWSGTASATPATRPGVPRSLTAESANHAVRLSWQAPRSNGGASIADYVIQRSSNGGGSWRTVADGASTSRNVTIGGLTNGTRYRFRVAAKNRVGVGAWSGTASATPATRPGVPRSLTAESANHAVRLSWQAPRSNGGASIADYVIQRSSNGGGSWRTVADGASTSRNVTIGGLTNGTRYHFRVAAKNRVGVGAWSGTASATPAEMDPPSNPEDDGSIAAAGYTGIGTVRDGITLSATIGDGPHGSTGSGTGDFDFYAVNLHAGDTLVVETATPTGQLDTMILVYDSTGQEVEFNDDYNGLDSRVQFAPLADGTYYVVVSGYYNTPLDPFDSQSGDGAASEGPYSLTLTAG